ncbi:GGDEF domain-containing phosphodiesterase [Vibrio hannami]|uniref:GGDEF domain-containing phosphodiesterase n=1 Tax=Vibrio hannami TaxID=2717094 RepID=UPI0024109C23|nr:GGDEF domain-containing phosphodiesterase [Vibrio hannami]MDG3087923.1 GGDEF domain-containing phosphodiesterase [Vibrio hannami]
MENISAQITAMKVAFVLIDNQSEILGISEEARSIFGCGVGDSLFDSSDLEFVNESFEMVAFKKQLEQAIVESGHGQFELGITSVSRTISWYRVELIPYSDNYILYLEDINELVGARRLNQQLSQKDPHTGLLYREAFLKEIKDLNLSGIVCCVRICNYQRINEIWGTAVANIVYMEMLARVQLEWDYAICAKHSIDSFYVFVDYSRDLDLELLYSKLNEPFQFNGNHFYSNVALGYYCERDDDDLEKSMNKAEIAIFDVLDNRNRLVEFQEEFAVHVEHQNKLENAFRHAVAADLLGRDFYTCIQPVHDEITGKVAGGECLMRWELEGTPVSPVEFIPIAERLGEIAELTKLSIKTIGTVLNRLKEQDVDVNNYTFAINISVVEILDVDFIDKLTQYLDESEINPEQIKVELTETAFVENFTYVNMVLSQLQLRGFKVSIDDFGTGFSSMSYLCRLSFDEIKIDRSFVSGVITNQRKQMVFNALASLSQNLGKAIVAEGVEEHSQLVYAKAKGVQFIQGYYYSKPLLPDEFVNYLLSHQEST